MLMLRLARSQKWCTEWMREQSVLKHQCLLSSHTHTKGKVNTNCLTVRMLHNRVVIKYYIEHITGTWFQRSPNSVEMFFCPFSYLRMCREAIVAYWTRWFYYTEDWLRERFRWTWNVCFIYLHNCTKHLWDKYLARCSQDFKQVFLSSCP